MRSAVTWVVVGALGLITLAAGLDALRGAAGAPQASRSQSARDHLEAPMDTILSAPPTLVGRAAQRVELERAGAAGTLYFTDAECRLWALELPRLDWRWKRSARASDCRFALAPDGKSTVFGQAAWAPSSDLSAVQDSRRPLIELSSPATGWRYRFDGSEPAFRPDGTLTFIKDGELWEWSDRCPLGAQTIVFRSVTAVERCPRMLLSRSGMRRMFSRSLRYRLSEYAVRDVAWLDESTVVVRIEGLAREQLLAVLARGRVLAVIGAFGAFGTAVPGELEVSTHGTYVTTRFGAGLDVLVFERRLRTRFVPRSVGRVRAIAWSPGECFAAVATETSVFIVHVKDARARPIRLPLATSNLAWSPRRDRHVRRLPTFSGEQLGRAFRPSPRRQAPSPSACSYHRSTPVPSSSARP